MTNCKDAKQACMVLGSSPLHRILPERSRYPPFGQERLLPAFEAYAKERQQRGRWQVHPDSVAVLKQSTHRSLKMDNVLAYIPGKRSDEYVIVGAHFDHLGVDETLADDKIYNGADDNASGVSAVLQIARAFALSGEKPLRNVIFAFWDGEEKVARFKTFRTALCPFLKQIKGYLNFDMIGRNSKPEQPQHVVYFYTAAHPAFGEWLKRDITRYGLQLQPDYRPWDNPVGGSDNASVRPFRHPRHLVSHRRPSRLSPAVRPRRITELGKSRGDNQGILHSTYGILPTKATINI